MFKSGTIKGIITDKSLQFVTWCRSASTLERFMAFVLLMVARLFVSTLVPPTSPAFGIIIQMSTPEDSAWTAMPFFLLASTLAGATPWLLDKLVELFCKEDLMYTKFMHKFTSNWPLTCWTFPTMKGIFHSVQGGEMGASIAVIVAHAAPFMGAQTTQIQRYFLPHPLDTIISQPFGMSEDLLSMAMAEATSNPGLGSASLTVIIALFNAAHFVLFSGCTDIRACFCAILNILCGLLVWSTIAEGHGGITLVGEQLLVQLFAVPFLSDRLCRCCGLPE